MSFDFKKEYKEFYLPKNKPEIVTVPSANIRLHDFISKNGYINDFSDKRIHHEIYLSDVRRVDRDKLKTVIRHPIKAVCVHWLKKILQKLKSYFWLQVMKNWKIRICRGDLMSNAVVNYYENYHEEDRITTNNARRIEFLTTIHKFDELLSGNLDIW